MFAWTRNHLTQLDAGIFPAFGFISITKIIRGARAVKNYQLPEIILAVQNMSQRRAQRSDAGSHGDKNQIAAAQGFKIKAMSRYIQ